MQTNICIFAPAPFYTHTQEQNNDCACKQRYLRTVIQLHVRPIVQAKSCTDKPLCKQTQNTHSHSETFAYWNICTNSQCDNCANAGTHKHLHAQQTNNYTCKQCFKFTIEQTVFTQTLFRANTCTSSHVQRRTIVQTTNCVNQQLYTETIIRKRICTCKHLRARTIL